MEIYKKGQGTVARWTTIISLGALAAFGASELFQSIYKWLVKAGNPKPSEWAWGVSIAVFVACMALIALLTSIHRFVDYLIASELELRKVAWPTKAELKRQTIVVIFTLVLFGIVLFLADAMFSLGFHKIYFKS